MEGQKRTSAYFLKIVLISVKSSLTGKAVITFMNLTRLYSRRNISLGVASFHDYILGTGQINFTFKSRRKREI